MVKRWSLRCFFLSLLLLCVGGWAISHAHPFSVDNWRPSTGGYAVHWETGAAGGYIDLLYSHMSGGDEVSDWHLERRLLGFSVEADHEATGLAWLAVYVPFWFPSILSALALFVVWRKTAKRKLGRPFPVEMAAKERGA